MNKTKLFMKTIGYSIKLSIKSSGFMLPIYFVLTIIASTLTLFGTFALKQILDSVATNNSQISLMLLWIGLYCLSLLISPVNTSARNLLYDSLFKKAEHRYECDLEEKLAPTVSIHFLVRVGKGIGHWSQVCMYFFLYISLIRQILKEKKNAEFLHCELRCFFSRETG